MKMVRNARQNRFVLLACTAFLALASALLLADERTPIPELHARVTDLTQTLTAEQTAALDGELAALETRKGAQIALLMIATLAPPADVPAEPEDIESYATRVFEQWKLGRKGIDDGVLLIVVKNDHKVRIEVGYGLEGAIPDAAAARIIREYIAPRFREGDYYGGIHAATAVLTQLIDGEALPAPLEGAGHAQEVVLDEGPGNLAVFFGSLMLGLVLGLTLENVLNFFPIGVISIGARRVIGLLAGPAIIAGLCYFVWGFDLSQVATTRLAIIAVVTSALGGYLAPQGASKVWAGGMTWGEFFDFKSWPSAIIEFVVSGVIGGLLGAIVGGGGGGGFSGGGGSSGGGGASGSW